MSGARWELIHLLAQVDGNDTEEETSLLDHLYGKQADAVLDWWAIRKIENVLGVREDQIAREAYLDRPYGKWST